MTTNPNKEMNVKFEIELMSIELDLMGWLKALFSRNVSQPLAKIAGSRKAQADDSGTVVAPNRILGNELA